MKKILLITIFSVTTIFAAWGQQTITVNKKEKTQAETTTSSEQKKEKSLFSNFLSTDEKNKFNSLSRDEKKALIISKLKESKDKTLNLKSNGEKLYLNIPLFKPIIIKLPSKITETLYISNGKLEILEDPSDTKQNYLKLRSIHPLLKDEEINLKSIDGYWLTLNLSTSLNGDRYTKININSPFLESDKNKNFEKLRKKYFNKKYNMKEINKYEIQKAISLIIDRLNVNSKGYEEQKEILEPINDYFIENKKLGLFIKNALVEPFQIVSLYTPGARDKKIEKEIVLLDMYFENYTNKTFKLTPTLIKKLFPKYIAFWYDTKWKRIGPQSKERIIVVYEKKMKKVSKINKHDKEKENNPSLFED